MKLSTSPSVIHLQLYGNTPLQGSQPHACILGEVHSMVCKSQISVTFYIQWHKSWQSFLSTICSVTPHIKDISHWTVLPASFMARWKCNSCWYFQLTFRKLVWRKWKTCNNNPILWFLCTLWLLHYSSFSSHYIYNSVQIQ